MSLMYPGVITDDTRDKLDSMLTDFISVWGKTWLSCDLLVEFEFLETLFGTLGGDDKGKYCENLKGVHFYMPDEWKSNLFSTVFDNLAVISLEDHELSSRFSLFIVNELVSGVLDMFGHSGEDLPDPQKLVAVHVISQSFSFKFYLDAIIIYNWIEMKKSRVHIVGQTEYLNKFDIVGDLSLTMDINLSQVSFRLRDLRDLEPGSLIDLGIKVGEKVRLTSAEIGNMLEGYLVGDGVNKAIYLDEVRNG